MESSDFGCVKLCNIRLDSLTFLDHRHDRVPIIYQQLTQRFHFTLNFNFNFNSRPCLRVIFISCPANPVWFTVTWRWSGRGRRGRGYRVNSKKGAEDFLNGYSLKVGYFGISIESEIVEKKVGVKTEMKCMWERMN